MRKILLLLVLLMSFAVSLRSQNLTTVTATVSDSAGTAYSFGNYTVSLVNTTSQQPLFGGNSTFQQVYSGSLDTNGVFSISLPSVTVMTPSPGLQWKFFICANPLQIAAIFPKPALPCFTYTSTGTQISGSSVDLSSSMTPTVIPKAGQGGAGTFTTITAANENGVIWVDGAKYTTIDAAIAAVPVVTISSCSESGTTATCITSTSHGFSVGQNVFLQGTSVTGYGDEQKLISPTSGTTLTFTTGSGLGASTGGTVGAITTIIIPSTYFGAEASTCASVDGFTQSLTPPHLTVIDYRGSSACGYNMAFNSAQQGGKPSLLSIWHKVTSPVSTSSALIATNQMTGVPPVVGTIASVTAETDLTGAMSAGTFPTIIAHEGYVGIRGTGNTLPLVISGQFGGSIDRSTATTNVTTFAALRADQIGNSSSSGATITNAYGLFAPAQNKGTARNYGGFFVQGATGTNFGSILLGYNAGTSIDSEDSGGVPHRVLFHDTSDNTILQASNGAGILFKDSTGVTQASLNSSAFQFGSGHLFLNGATSGTSILNAPVSGGGTTTLPQGSGTVAYGATAYLTSNYTNATTTFSSVTGLSFSVSANTNYKVRCDLDYQTSATTADVKIQWTGPASPTAITYDLVTEVTGSTLSASVATAFSTALSEAGTPTITTNFPLTLTLTLINGANAGTIQLQVAATGVGTITIVPGSCTLSQ